MWPFQKSLLKDIDACNFQLMAMVAGVKLHEDESAEAFCRRRIRKVKSEILEAGVMLSDHWAFKTVTWLEHLSRHPACPAARLLQQLTPEWLETCQILSGRSSQHASDRPGITLTRGGRGQPIRYLSAWWRMIEFVNPHRDACFTRQHAFDLQHLMLYRT